MRFRKLRIAWLVAWGVACVLLVVLWVRSYWREEDIGGRFVRVAFRVASVRARLVGSFAWVPSSEGGLSFKVNSELDNDTEIEDADLSEIQTSLDSDFFRIRRRAS